MNTQKFQKLFGERVRMLRKRQGLTQEELAEKIERTPNTVSNIETGTVSPNVETIISIAKVLEVDIAELFNVAENLTADKKKRSAIEQIVSLLQNQDMNIIKAVEEQIKTLTKLIN